jgi:xanthosine utilization system XapX-like protein
VATSWLHHQVKPHVFGELPKCLPAQTAAETPNKETRHG